MNTMTAPPTCLRCRFWEKLYLEDQEHQYRRGECRRNPPALLPQRFYMIDGTTLVENGAQWPVTSHEDWCGKFEAREDVKP